jgi:hypothetical protein
VSRRSENIIRKERLTPEQFVERLKNVMFPQDADQENVEARRLEFTLVEHEAGIALLEKDNKEHEPIPLVPGDVLRIGDHSIEIEPDGAVEEQEEE